MLELFAALLRAMSLLPLETPGELRANIGIVNQLPAGHEVQWTEDDDGSNYREVIDAELQS